MGRIQTMPQCLTRNGLFYKSFPHRFILKRIKVDFAAYFKKFSRTLMAHMENEYEVQIRDGVVTEAGEQNLLKLESDFHILQYESNIREIVVFHKNKHKELLNRNQCLIDLLDVVRDDLISNVRLNIFKTHKDVLKNRRIKTNLMCDKKCEAGASVFNFTDHVIHPSLLKHLKSGLKSVPVASVDISKLVVELETEAIAACKEMYRATYGYYPKSDRNSLDKSIIGIISQCSSNSVLVGQLSDFRQSFVESLPVFLSSIPDSGLDVRKLLSLVTQGCIITNSDKNVGISILPPAWYEKEYQSQISKGGHEFVNMTEGECLAYLSKQIDDFKKGCSQDQLKILTSLWPKSVIKKPRLGVMKLVPKVNSI